MNKLFFIKKNHEFQKIIKKNNHYFSSNFLFFIDNNNLGYTRFGLSVGKKKYKLAVTRNKIRRQLRHILQMYIKENNKFIELPIDIIIIFKVKKYNDINFAQLKSSLYNILDNVKRKHQK